MTQRSLTNKYLWMTSICLGRVQDWGLRWEPGKVRRWRHQWVKGLWIRSLQGTIHQPSWTLTIHYTQARSAPSWAVSAGICLHLHGSPVLDYIRHLGCDSPLLTAVLGSLSGELWEWICIFSPPNAPTQGHTDKEYTVIGCGSRYRKQKEKPSFCYWDGGYLPLPVTA